MFVFLVLSLLKNIISTDRIIEIIDYESLSEAQQINARALVETK